MILKELMKLVDQALKKNEVPVAAVIVENDQIIAKAYNKTEKQNCVTGHAEIQVIKIASKKLKTWHLDNCELYVTLEPCDMCWGAIRLAHIKKTFYLVKSNKNVTFKTIKKQIANNNTKRNYVDKLQAFFKEKR